MNKDNNPEKFGTLDPDTGKWVELGKIHAQFGEITVDSDTHTAHGSISLTVIESTSPDAVDLIRRNSSPSE